MDYMEELRNKIYAGYEINKTEAMLLVKMPLDELSQIADEMRKYFCGNKFDVMLPSLMAKVVVVVKTVNTALNQHIIRRKLRNILY